MKIDFDNENETKKLIKNMNDEDFFKICNLFKDECYEREVKSQKIEGIKNLMKYLSNKSIDELEKIENILRPKTLKPSDKPRGFVE